LTALCHKISKENGLTFNSVMLYYFLESILKKLVQGKYGENLVFKGGFLLSNVVGIESRSTMDIDILVRDTQVSEEKVSEMLDESLKEKEEDEIHYEIVDISPIKEQDQYGGYRASVLCKFDNIRQVIPLDLATGDVITPHPIQYSFASVFGDDEILIKAYPIETMLAEKLQTIYARGFLNSRNERYQYPRASSGKRMRHLLFRLKGWSISPYIPGTRSVMEP
jgi:predicted nucleotidyltransferase component of viral defense system